MNVTNVTSNEGEISVDVYNKAKINVNMVSTV